MAPPIISASLSEFYAVESAKIRRAFESSGDGQIAARARAQLVDAIALELYKARVSPDCSGPEGFCLAALGGYGRSELFPHSDVDLLFLTESAGTIADHREAVAAVMSTMWDVGLRVSSTSRTLAECGELHRDNLEFNISLLDSRYLAGDAYLFTRLRERALPHLVARDRPEMVRRLGEMTEARHEKHANTIFHLEPNIKETSGGMRDYHVARWLAMIFQLEQGAGWKGPEEIWPKLSAEAATNAYSFLAATRTFLHYRKERDDNHLTYELQDEAAAAGIGTPSRVGLPAEEWMRDFFRHARSVDRLLTKIFEEAEPPRTSLYGLFQDWRSRLSTPDFSVIRGRIFPRQSAEVSGDLNTLLALFEFSARHGLELSREAEHLVEVTLFRLDEGALRSPEVWEGFRRILVAPNFPQALRAMHRLGLLDAMFPEFRAIDSLVVRDYYHRYTVDEHTLLTLESLSRLRRKESGDGLSGWARKFSEVLQELPQPELLFMALLFHDVGKGISPDDHVRGSLEAIAHVFERLSLNPQDSEQITFLILNHLEMSSTLTRRDIFDPEVVRAFAEKVGTPERLKMLTLMTYADIQSVNPEALTPWKEEMLWQLYAAASNYLTRSLDGDRLHTSQEEGLAVRMLPQLARAANSPQLAAFLEGFPRRYLLTHSPEQILEHFELAGHLNESGAQLKLRDDAHSFELTVITHDRPHLFASLAGALTAWGMNILKADAFSNAAGIVLDTFRFVDLYRTLELNPSERGRFQQNIIDVISSKTDLQELLSGRVNNPALPRVKVRVPTQIRFEEPPIPSGVKAPARSTLLEVIAQDRPGLLYQISSVLAELELNIEVALIDTEGQKAIDVFYLTSQGARLSDAQQTAVCTELLRRLQ